MDSKQIERFWNKVDTHNFNADLCWEWIGTRGQRNYGRVYLNCRRIAASRVSYEIFNGFPVPVGLEMDHLCRNHLCVNPYHLEAITHQENLARGNGSHSTAKTHCTRGHPYVGTNHKTGHRLCLICKRIRDRNRYRKAKMGVLV